MDQIYDYVIVGAGSAGSVLAARLTEDPDCRVMLLEAGRDYTVAEMPPEMKSKNPFNMILPKHYQAEYLWPTLNARRSSSQQPRMYWRGRGTGGSSSINGQIAIRGVMAAFDEWAEYGADGWSAKEVLPYFNRLESDGDFSGDAFHGGAGPTPVYRMPQENWGPVDKALRDSAMALGHPWADDLNAPDATGVTTFAINIRDGKRISVNDAYLEGARKRPNLTIVGRALVDRVLWEGKRAAGVRVRVDGAWQDVRGRHVVLSAGAVHSPAILLRSGVGPAAQLAKFGIAQVQELPVGRHFFDHPFVRLELKLKPEYRPKDAHERHTNCCVKFSSGIAGGGFNDLIYFSMNHGGFGVEGDPDMFGEAGIHVSLFECFSQGSVELESPDPEVQPVVDLNMLSDERDLARFRKGARELMQIGQHPAVAGITRAVYAGNSGLTPAEMDARDDEAFDEWLLADCSDAQHGAGSCRIGIAGVMDGESVVDPDCAVKGIDGLWVVDASVMPRDCRANTNFTTIMIGEKMADHFRKTGAARR